MQYLLHRVTGARSVGSEVTLRNQTSGESIGLTRWDVASLFINLSQYVFSKRDLAGKILTVHDPPKG